MMFLRKYFKFDEFLFESVKTEKTGIAQASSTETGSNKTPVKASPAKKPGSGGKMSKDNIERERKEEEQKLENERRNKNLELSKKIIKVINEKTEGNPLTAIHFFENLMIHEIFRLEKRSIIVKESLERMIELDELLTINAPLCRTKIIGQLIDRLSCEQHLIMKTASVIGECFDFQTLVKVNPFKLSITPEKLRKILSDLESMDYIEILDEQEHNITYRLTHTFMREVLYQRMIFNQRRQIHRS